MKHYFNDRDLDLAANDVIIAIDGKISRANAKLVAKATLEGFGIMWRPNRGPKRPHIVKREGADACLCSDE